MKIIAVAGASGFIGRGFLRLMASRSDVTLRILVRKAGQAAGLGPTVAAIQGDITEPASLRELLVDGCTLVNLVYLPHASLSENLHCAQSMLETCVSLRVKRLVHCSTAAVAGRAAAEVITEDTECLPGSDYEQAKLATEQALLRGGQARIEVTILRPTAVFGPGGRNLMKLLYNLTRRSAAYNYLLSCAHGRRRMNLVHIDNVAAALSLLADPGRDVAGRTFIVSDDDTPANNYRDVERLLRASLGLPAYPVPPVGLSPVALSLALRLAGRTNTNPARTYDCSRMLGIGLVRPKTLEQGLAEFGGWYRRRQNSGCEREGT